MPLRAGDHRAQLLFEAARRSELGVLLARVLPALEREPSARWVRWSIDVDPQELL
jgi:primosomal protein N' (replication factor Y)